MEPPVKVERYGFEVWENPKSDAMRREECLCTNCRFVEDRTCPVSFGANLYPVKVANLLFEICLATGMAMCITRCPKWEAK